MFITWQGERGKPGLKVEPGDLVFQLGFKRLAINYFFLNVTWQGERGN